MEHQTKADLQGEIVQLRERIAELKSSDSGAEEERKRTEQDLRYHAKLVESVSDAIVSTDTEFKIRSWCGVDHAGCLGDQTS